MVLDLVKLEYSELNETNLEVVKVGADEQKKKALEVIAQVFAQNESHVKFWKHHVDFAFENKQHDLYLAILNDVPVGVSEVSYYGGVAGLFTVGTIPAARKKGIGSAVTLAPLFDAKKKGYKWSVLHASEMGYNVYKRLGFEDFGLYHHAKMELK